MILTEISADIVLVFASVGRLRVTEEHKMPFDNTNYPERRSGAGQVATTPHGPRCLTELRDLQVLSKARDSLRKPGSWCQREFTNGRGARCAVGWIHYHLTGEDMMSGQNECGVRLAARRFGRIDDLVALNDHPHTTREMVVAKFDDVIARLEGRDA